MRKWSNVQKKQNDFKTSFLKSVQGWNKNIISLVRYREIKFPKFGRKHGNGDPRKQGKQIYLLARDTRGGVCARAGLVEPACGVSPFSMTKSPPGQAKPGVENRKKKILISLSAVNEQTLCPLCIRIGKQASAAAFTPRLARNRRTEEQQADGIKGRLFLAFLFSPWRDLLLGVSSLWRKDDARIYDRRRYVEANILSSGDCFLFPFFFFLKNRWNFFFFKYEGYFMKRDDR